MTILNVSFSELVKSNYMVAQYLISDAAEKAVFSLTSSKEVDGKAVYVFKFKIIDNLPVMQLHGAIKKADAACDFSTDDFFLATLSKEEGALVAAVFSVPVAFSSKLMVSDLPSAKEFAESYFYGMDNAWVSSNQNMPWLKNTSCASFSNLSIFAFSEFKASVLNDIWKFDYIVNTEGAGFFDDDFANDFEFSPYHAEMTLQDFETWQKTICKSFKDFADLSKKDMLKVLALTLSTKWSGDYSSFIERFFSDSVVQAAVLNNFPNATLDWLKTIDHALFIERDLNNPDEAALLLDDVQFLLSDCNAWATSPNLPTRIACLRSIRAPLHLLTLL